MDSQKRSNFVLLAIDLKNECSCVAATVINYFSLLKLSVFISCFQITHRKI